MRRGGLDCLALARWAGWSAGQVGRHVKNAKGKRGVEEGSLSQRWRALLG